VKLRLDKINIAFSNNLYREKSTVNSVGSFSCQPQFFCLFDHDGAAYRPPV
jgi:hypothetical protein